MVLLMFLAGKHNKFTAERACNNSWMKIHLRVDDGFERYGYSTLKLDLEF